MYQSQIMDSATGAVARRAQEAVKVNETASLVAAHLRLSRIEDRAAVWDRSPKGIRRRGFSAHQATFGQQQWINLWSATDTVTITDKHQADPSDLSFDVECTNMAARVCFPACAAPDALTRVNVECPVTLKYSEGVAECSDPHPLAMEAGPTAKVATMPLQATATKRAPNPDCPGCGGKGVLPAKTKRADAVPMGGAALAILGAVALPGLGLPASFHDVLMLVGAGLIGAVAARAQAGYGDDARILTSPCCWCCEDTPNVQVFIPDGYIRVCKDNGDDTTTCVAVPYVGCGDACSDAGCFPVECEPCA